MDSTQSLPGWHTRAVVGSMLLAATGYLGFALWSGWQEVLAAIGKVGVLGVAAALSLSLANYGLRFIRWQAYLRAMDHPVPWRPSLKIYIAGFALTTTPGKAGEALRGVLLKRLGTPYPTSLAAFLSERLSDLLAVVVLTLFGLTVYPMSQPMVAVGAAGVVAAFLVLSSQGLLQRLHGAVTGTARIASLLRDGLQVLLQARRCHTPALLAGATGLSLVAWAAEAWAFHLILQWMGLDVPLGFAVFVYAISMLAGALSFMPGGLGGAEFAMVTLLAWQGIPGPDAIAATVLIRLTTLWFAVGIGVPVLSCSLDK
ncbi:lysylphosphatidylglycerol synthase transmembrane domain-containing protein [Lysobacter sp. D1-1-M9]|uniref:lysylphosphatidylglycerol synthase transmembrane domain-containing protein n=1 Tax=Novilysobacter longmucuonensis TaxID=3098603 RepID=UPI002FCA9AB9